MRTGIFVSVAFRFTAFSCLFSFLSFAFALFCSWMSHATQLCLARVYTISHNFGGSTHSSEMMTTIKSKRRLAFETFAPRIVLCVIVFGNKFASFVRLSVWRWHWRWRAVFVWHLFEPEPHRISTKCLRSIDTHTHTFLSMRLSRYPLRTSEPDARVCACVTANLLNQWGIKSIKFYCLN